jgi:DNA modification methylase
VKPYYQESGITIYLGDCREILPQLGRFDLLLTDPPYGIGHLMQGGKDTGHWGQLSSGNPWDMQAPELADVIPHGETAVIWGGNYFPLPPSRMWLAWVKTNSVPTQADMELAWTNADACARRFEHPSGGSYVRVHPTQKPLPLMKWCLSLFPEAKTVLDPFCGSGTTLVAAKDMGLSAVGIEAEEKYCAIAAERLRQSVFNFEEISA